MKKSKPIYGNTPDKNRQEYIIRCKRPTKGLEVDYGNGRKSAIHLACFNCMGLNEKDQIQISHVEKCEGYHCPLWRYRPGKGNRTLPAGIVPTEDEYKAMIGTTEE